MYMIQVSVCRDIFTYDKLSIEHTEYPKSQADNLRLFNRSCRDYKAWADRKEDQLSLIIIRQFQFDEASKSWGLTNEWEHRLPLKKMTVVNPELEAKRTLKKPSSRIGLWQQVDAMLPQPVGQPVPQFDEEDEE